MAAPYSLDLRRKVIQACESQDQSQRAVAEFFGVSLSFVEGLLRRMRRSGELVPPRRRPGPRVKIDLMACEQIQAWLQERPDLTLAELAERLQARGAAAVSTPTLCRVLQRLGLRRKKRRSTPANAIPRRYVRHAVNTGRTFPPFIDATEVCRRVGRQHCDDAPLWASPARPASA